MKKIEFDYSNMKRIVVEAMLLVCLGVAVGLMFNYQLVRSVFEGKLGASRAVEPGGPIAIDPVPVVLDDVREMLSRVVLVDARIPELFEKGRLPGAVSLPLADFDDAIGTFLEQYPDRSLIIYCSGYGCNDSFDLAVLMLDKGYRDVMVYEGGFPEWRDAGLPVERGGP